MKDITVSNIDNAKKKKNKDEDKINFEYLWGLELRRRNDFAYESTQDENKSLLYTFDKTSRIWRKVKDAKQIEKEVLKFVDKTNSGKKRNQSIKACADLTMTEVLAYGRKLEKSKEFIISTINHILHFLDDGRIRCHAKDDLMYQGKEYFCKVHVPIDLGVQGEYYVPQKTLLIEQKDTLFSMLIKSAFPDPLVRECAQEHCGDTLSPILRKAVVLFIGKKNGGKSQILDLIKMMHLNSCVARMDNLERFGMAQFPSSSMIIVDELGERINEALFKGMVGGSVLQVTIPYEGPCTIVPDFKMAWGANEMPKIYDKSGAVETRIYPIPVETNKGKRIEELSNKIKEKELRDVFDWFVNGALKVIKRGRIMTHEEMPIQCRKEMDKINKTSNPGIDWAKDVEIIPDEKNLIPKQDVFDNFRNWCLMNGHANYAKMSISVWSRDIFKKTMHELHGIAYKEDLERRATVSTGAFSKRRVDCFPVSFKNDPNAVSNSVSTDEVSRSYHDTEAYKYSDNIPDHIVKKIQAEQDKIDAIVKMNEEQKRKFFESKMIDEGYTKNPDGSWDKII